MAGRLPGAVDVSDDEEELKERPATMMDVPEKAERDASKRWTHVASEAVEAARSSEDGVRVDRLIKLFQREVNKGFIFKELIPYCSFLALMLIVVMVSRSEQYDSKVHRTLNGVHNALLDNNYAMAGDLQFKKTFWDVSSEDDWWRWLDQPFLANIWPHGDAGVTMVATANKPLGFLILRQLRVAPEACSHNEAYSAVAASIEQYLPTTCYPDYRCTLLTNTLSDAAYGTGETFVALKHNESKLSFTALSGRYETYGCSGYSFVEKIPVHNHTLTEAVDRVRRLRAAGWVDESTRLVSAELILFNRNYDVFVFFAAFVEISAGGLWHPDVRIVPFQFLSVERAAGVAIFVIDIVVTVYFLYIFYRLVQTLVRNLRLHGEIVSFFAFWNTYALADMILFMVTYGYRWSFWHITMRLRGDVFNQETQADVEDMWSSLARYAMLYEISWNCYGFACALAIGGLFRFTQYNPRLFLLVETVERALGELISVVAMMSVVVFAYGILGHLLFGYYLDEYASFIASCGTLLRLLIGDFPDQAFYAIRDTQHSSVIAFIYLTSYTFIAWAILLNMILAIINESLAAVKQKAGQKDIMIMKWLQKHSHRVIGLLTRPKAERQRHKAEALVEKEQRAAREAVLKACYDKLKVFRASPKYRETLLKRQLKQKIDWTEEEWVFLDGFMFENRAEVCDKESDTPERQKLEQIHQLLQQVATTHGVNPGGNSPLAP
ncbi:Polycystin-2 [Diplonema papillatum]|nr:Polycystin-2 [Diplonema papillatum]